MVGWSASCNSPFESNYPGRCSVWVDCCFRLRLWLRQLRQAPWVQTSRQWGCKDRVRITPKHMIVGLGGPSREDMLKYPRISKSAYARQTQTSKSARLGYPSRQDMLLYASTPPLFFFFVPPFFFGVASQERKSSVFMKNTSGVQNMRAVLLIIFEVERTRLDKI